MRKLTNEGKALLLSAAVAILLYAMLAWVLL